MTCKHLQTTMTACTLCKAQAHIDRLSTVHCHPSNRAWVAESESSMQCEYIDKRCINCHSVDVQHYEMDESFEHKCTKCGLVWLRFMDDGETVIMDEGQHQDMVDMDNAITDSALVNAIKAA